MTVSRPIGGGLSTGPLRESGWVTIHLCGLPGSVSGRAALSLFGLAPDGVCLAGQVTPAAGALLPHRFTLTCARSQGAGPSAVCSLWHFPAGRPDWPLASILPCGAPTFLSVETTPRPPGRLTVPTSLAPEFPLRRTGSATSNTPDMEALVRTPGLTSLAVRPAPVDGDRTVEPWYLRGACRGLDSAIFYPDPVEESAIEHALSVCQRCDVRPECLDHALLRREPTGIWGGTTERDRRRILRRRRSA